MNDKKTLTGEYQNVETVAIQNYLTENQERLNKLSRGFADRIITQLNNEVGDIRNTTKDQIEQNFLSCVKDVTNKINLSFIEIDSEIKKIKESPSVLPQMTTHKIKAAIDRFNNKCKTGLNSIKLLGNIPTELENNINEMKQILSSYTQ